MFQGMNFDIGLAQPIKLIILLPVLVEIIVNLLFQ